LFPAVRLVSGGWYREASRPARERGRVLFLTNERQARCYNIKRSGHIPRLPPTRERENRGSSWLIVFLWLVKYHHEHAHVYIDLFTIIMLSLTRTRSDIRLQWLHFLSFIIFWKFRIFSRSSIFLNRKGPIRLLRQFLLLVLLPAG